MLAVSIHHGSYLEQDCHAVQGLLGVEDVFNKGLNSYQQYGPIFEIQV